jgi:hypothetical protein
MLHRVVNNRLSTSTSARLVLAVTCLLLGGPISLAQDTAVVHGLDDSSRDPARVQSAVDRGGIVVLRGTFDFGDSGSVSIRRDVEILGEMANGQPSTTVKGGEWSFHSPLPKTLPPTEPGPSIAIRRIHFDGASWAPIHIAYARRVVVSDNRITAVRPAPSPAPVLGRAGLLLQHGISLGPFLSFPGTYPAASLTGEVRIERNHIDLWSEDPTRTMGQAIIMLWATGARAHILDNTAVNVSRNAIEALENYPGSMGDGFVLIRGNDVTTPVDGLAFPSPSFPNGIVVGWLLDVASSADPARRMKYIVADNTIRTRGDSSMGIAVRADDSVVANNTIIAEGKASRPLVMFGSDATVVGNRIEGTGVAAVHFSARAKPLAGSRNLLLGNATSSFQSAAGLAIQEDDGVQGNLLLDAGR